MLLDIVEPNTETVAVGIDLGTTNSIISVDGKVLGAIPSVVEGVRSIKRLMGRGVKDVENSAFSYDIDEASTDEMVVLNVNGKKITPVEISANILKALKNIAEESLCKRIDKAVITVPAYFDDAARTATKDSARLAGLEVLRLINEPTAAALAYGLDNDSEGIYAIYDLGGGTFDISILKMKKGVFQVLATGGNTSLGGDDFDRKIADYLSVDMLTARKTKEHLTNNDVFQGLTKEKFNSLIEDYIDETIEIFKSVMEEIRVRSEHINGIVMVGGSTRIPLVLEKIEKFTGQKPLTNVDPDMVVALGAAVQAKSLTEGSGTLLLDVTPLSLGLETMGGIVEKIIHRNTPIPASSSQKFTTYKDGQTGLKIQVLQGEREMVEQCRSLAKFELLGIPPMIAGAAVIEVTFTIDADGLLTVTAQEETTGIEQKVKVKPSYGLSHKKIEQMLIDSIENARTDITGRLLIESKVDAERTVYAIETALKDDKKFLDAAMQQKLEVQINLIKKLLKGTDRDAIDQEVSQLDKISQEFAEQRSNRAIGDFLEGKQVLDI